MSPWAMTLAALALLCLALSCWIWGIAQARDRRQRMERFIAEQIAAAEVVRDVTNRSAKSAMRLEWAPAGWSSLIRRAGVTVDLGLYLRLAAVGMLFVFVGTFLGGVLGGFLGLVAILFGSVFWLFLRANRRREKMIDQLPDLLDVVVRLVTIGNSVGAAFQTAADHAESPLAEVMGRVASLNRSGLDLDHALDSVANLYGVRELHLLAAILGLAIRFGGRSDQVLERTAAFMRDLRQARQELVAMSAEIRLSAWILALLPIAVACVIVVFNNGLFMSMWNDDVGRMLLAIALFLQAIGSLWLYRLARSV